MLHGAPKNLVEWVIMLLVDMYLILEACTIKTFATFWWY